MKGRKSYNIRNVEAHLNTFTHSVNHNLDSFSNVPCKNMFFQNIVSHTIQATELQQQNEFINAKFGVSKYASNLVSGRMFKKI